jgi:hypothetical protein
MTMSVTAPLPANATDVAVRFVGSKNSCCSKPPLSKVSHLPSSLWAFCLFMAVPAFCASNNQKSLAVGVAGHAFDHLGNIGDQADAAAASGANIIYASGLGALGYQGLPAEPEFLKQKEHVAAYVTKARKSGIRLAIGYVCATSIVKLDTFDRHWPESLRKRFHSAPAEWRQIDRNGKPLKSWYGGDYEPACMNNPDWRSYEKFMVRQQLEAGCDGIFFDNPTVHPQGCYCSHCMDAFDRFLGIESALDSRPVEKRRAYAAEHPREFTRFRCTIARDFFEEIRAYARSIKRDALITANNSLNSPEALFSQCRSYAYNIYEMSKTEDFVVVEDMASQPRTLPGEKTVEYGPTYKQLNAISHSKPVVAVTIADADYHTAPHLVRLAMAEAAANDASYLSWPTWPEAQRQHMIETIRPQADFMRRNATLLTGTKARADVVLFLPFRKWIETDDCATSRLAAELTKANTQYEVMCEDSFAPLSGTKVLLADPRDLNAEEKEVVKRFAERGGLVLTPEGSDTALLTKVKLSIGRPSVTVKAPQTVRVIVRDQGKRTIVHAFNLNILKVSSFEDKVTPADNVEIEVRVQAHRVHSVRKLSADDGRDEKVPFITRTDGGQVFVKTLLPRLEIASLLVIE